MPTLSSEPLYLQASEGSREGGAWLLRQAAGRSRPRIPQYTRTNEIVAVAECSLLDHGGGFASLWEPALFFEVSCLKEERWLHVGWTWISA
jgi:hypothetical protein